MVFRSVAVPVKAALGFLLSIIAALGSVVAVFQWGWLAGLFQVDATGPVLSFLPILLVGRLFGLAMDYEVFLVSRMREEHAHGLAAVPAMQRGFAHSASVVTAAALIMVAVFGSFAFSHVRVVKGIGFALAVGACEFSRHDRRANVGREGTRVLTVVPDPAHGDVTRPLPAPHPR
ncbi:MMPL family transporter [Nonomuraea sp. NPDC049421]|uniref:MMPL family transporter n=1 Tax=Nonomuraea sp. NPDC049421 TaxID=3155275 RepID=UPI003419DBC9